MHGASYIQSNQHWIAGSGGWVSNKVDSPQDYAKVTTNQTLGQRTPVLAFATCRNFEGRNHIQRFHLILVQGAQYRSIWENCTHSLPADKSCNLMWSYSEDGKRRPTYLYVGNESGSLFSHVKSGETFSGPSEDRDVWPLNRLHFFDGFSHSPAFGSVEHICTGHTILPLKQIQPQAQRTNFRLVPDSKKLKRSDPQSATPVIDPAWTARTPPDPPQPRAWRPRASVTRLAPDLAETVPEQPRHQSQSKSEAAHSFLELEPRDHPTRAPGASMPERPAGSSSAMEEDGGTETDDSTSQPMQPTQPRVWRKRAAPVAPEPAATATEIENVIDLTSSDQEKDSSAAPESDTASSPDMVEPQDEGSATIYYLPG